MIRRAFPNPAEAEGFYAACGVPEIGIDLPDVSSEARHTLKQRMQSAAAADGHRLMLVKRIANNRRIGLLNEVFPTSRFVEITRDGRAVAASLSRVDWWDGSNVWWLGATPSEWRRQGGDPWELCARNWLVEARVTRDGLAQLPDAQVMSIRYEELVRNPREVLESVAAFIGLDPHHRSWRRSLRDVRFPDNNNRWREALDPQALATIESVQKPELLHLGYSV
jgi:hypothetical protein